MTDEEELLAEIRARREAIGAPGHDWLMAGRDVFRGQPDDDAPTFCVEANRVAGDFPVRAEQEFAAYAPGDVSFLLRGLDAARDEIATMRGAFSDFCQDSDVVRLAVRNEADRCAAICLDEIGRLSGFVNTHAERRQAWAIHKRIVEDKR